MREKILNLIFASHEGDTKKFLFQLPLGIEVAKGQKFYVDTMRGESIVIAETENIYVGRHTADALVIGCGAYEPLKMVTGYAVRLDKYEKQPFNGIPF